MSTTSHQALPPELATSRRLFCTSNSVFTALFTIPFTVCFTLMSCGHQSANEDINEDINEGISADVSPEEDTAACESDELCLEGDTSAQAQVKLPCDLEIGVEYCAPNLPPMCAIDLIDDSGALVSRERIIRDDGGRVVQREVTEDGHTLVTLLKTYDIERQTALEEQRIYNDSIADMPPRLRESLFIESTLDDELRPLQTREWRETYSLIVEGGVEATETETTPMRECTFEYQDDLMVKQMCTYAYTNESLTQHRTYDDWSRLTESVTTLSAQGEEPRVGSIQYEYNASGHLVESTRTSSNIGRNPIGWVANYQFLMDGRVHTVEHQYVFENDRPRSKIRQFVYNADQELMKVQWSEGDWLRVRHYRCDSL